MDSGRRAENERERQELRDNAVHAYRDLGSIRGVSEALGVSYGLAHALLNEAGEPRRRRGRPAAPEGDAMTTTTEFEPPPADEPVPAPGPSDHGAPVLPDPPDDGIEYTDPLSVEVRDEGEVSFRAVAAKLVPPTGAQVIAYAETFKGIAKGRKKENVNTFTEWYYGNETAASFCLIGICYVLNHFGVLSAFLGGKIAYVPDLKKRVGKKWHTAKADIREGDPVTFDFNKTNEPEHVGLFIRWANAAKTRFISFEFNTTGNGSDDYCGEKTRNWSDVYGYVKPGLSADDPSKYTGTIYKYTPGKKLIVSSHVKWIQQQLTRHGHAVTPDSEYGPKTASAVKSFQGDVKLTKDGQVGPKTWAALAK